MTYYVGVAATALAVRAVTGSGIEVAITALLILLVGGVLTLEFRLRRHHLERDYTFYRHNLDRRVLLQWVTTGAVALLFGVVFWAVGAPTVHLGSDSLARLVTALVTAVCCGIVAIQLSAFIDWYWILPRIGGITRLAPCEKSGERIWDRTTSVWLMHRAIATSIVCGCLVGPFVYMGQRTEHGSAAAWFVVAGLFAAATLQFLSTSGISLWQSLNPRVRLGDLLTVYGRPCLIVDVSIQGAKYVLNPDEPRDFKGDKCDESFPLGDFGRWPRTEGALPPCAAGCKGVNWYCRHNPRAYD